MNVLIIDNFDSFTFNLYQYCGSILQKRDDGSVVKVIRNNECDLEEIIAFNPDRIIISPGPGTPADPKYFGVCAEVITTLGKEVPLLGVCLGMQGICHCFGASIIHAKVPMHGKVSPMIHDREGVYQGLPQEIEIMRYHSLVADPATLPECLKITSVVLEEESDAGKSMKELLYLGREVMGVRHKEFPIEGIQFHPESFGTEGGMSMLENFIEL